MGWEAAFLIKLTISLKFPMKNRYGGPLIPCLAKCSSIFLGLHHSRMATFSTNKQASSTALVTYTQLLLSIPSILAINPTPSPNTFPANHTVLQLVSVHSLWSGGVVDIEKEREGRGVWEDVKREGKIGKKKGWKIQRVEERSFLQRGLRGLHLGSTVPGGFHCFIFKLYFLDQYALPLLISFNPCVFSFIPK